MREKEVVGFLGLVAFSFVINLLIKLLQGLIELGSYFAMPIFITLCFFFVGWVFLEIYAYTYFKGDQFKKLKKKLEKNTNNCNSLNQHIEELKQTYLKLNPFNYGRAEYYDDSNFNYKRPNFSDNIEDNNGYVLECSLAVCRNASLQPIKYLFKYFNVKKNEKTLEMFEEVFNNFSTVEQGKESLRKEREDLISRTKENVPFLIFYFFYNIIPKNFRRFNV